MHERTLTPFIRIFCAFYLVKVLADAVLQAISWSEFHEKSTRRTSSATTGWFLGSIPRVFKYTGKWTGSESGETNMLENDTYRIRGRIIHTVRSPAIWPAEWFRGLRASREGFWKIVARAEPQAHREMREGWLLWLVIDPPRKPCFLDKTCVTVASVLSTGRSRGAGG